MTLRFKTLLIVSGVLTSLVVVVYFLLRPMIGREFSLVEQQTAQEQMHQAQDAIANDLSQHARALQGWAVWDAMRDFVRKPTPAFETNELNASGLAASNLDFVAVLNTKGQLVYGVSYDIQGYKMALPEELRTEFVPSSPLLQPNRKPDAHGSIMAAGDHYLWFAVFDITDSKAREAPSGTLVIGRTMTAKQLEDEFRSLGHDVHVLTPQDATQWPGVHDGSVQQDDENTKVFAWQNDFRGRPIALLQISRQNVTAQRVKGFLDKFIVVVFFCAITGVIGAMWPLEQLVLRRVRRLNVLVDSVRSSGDLSKRSPEESADEIGQLAQGINGALSELDTLTTRMKRSEHLYREMAQTALSAGDAVMVWNSQTDEMEWHGDIETLLGYGRGRMARHWAGWLQHVHTGDQRRVANAFAHAALRKEPFEVEMRLVRCDGSRRYWLLRGKPMEVVQPIKGSWGSFNKQEEAGPVKLVAACLDITERKRAEEALRQSQQRLERIFETVADAIIIADGRGQVIFSNAAAERIYGLPREEMMNHNVQDALWCFADLDGNQLPMEQTPFHRVQEGGEPVYEVEHVVERPDGRRIVISVNAAPLMNDIGHFSGMVASVSDVTERRAMQDRLFYQAFHDALTGLANRSLLKNRLEHALAQRDLTEGHVAVVFIDLDNFKYINDSLGHAAGDELLISIAQRLKHSLRAGDTAARFGGDEFVILLESGDNPRYATSVAQRILDALKEPFMLDGREVFTTPSIGIAFSGAGYTHPDELLSQADAALYEAKGNGKARYEIYQTRLSEHAIRRLEIENDLRRALQKNEFEVYYQPKWDFKHDQLEGFEALVRWEHPQHGMRSPLEFIPVAEETGLIGPLGFFVLREACAQARLWSLHHNLPLSMAVNVSSHQLRMPEMVPLVAQVLQETGFPAEHLILEITETAIVERTNDSLKTMNALKELGVKLAIDDFGTGYSALAYLRDFPFDIMKIDRQFVTDISQKPGNSVIVASMISLAHALDLKVVAEGVELAEEAAHLQTLDCDQAQGYFFAPPKPADSISEQFGWNDNKPALRLVS